MKNMSGIFAFVGGEKPKELLLSGLENLQHRGGEVCGMVIADKDGFATAKTVGTVTRLAEDNTGFLPDGCCGIAKTDIQLRLRGAASTVPAANELFAAACSGYIADFESLKRWTRSPFAISTDDDLLLACLSISNRENRVELANTVAAALTGSPSFVFMPKGENELYAHAGKNMLFAGVGKIGAFLTDELSALLLYCDKYAVIENGETVRLRADKITFYDEKCRKIKKVFNPVTGRVYADGQASLGDEIHFCARAAREVYCNFVKNGALNLDALKLTKRAVERISRIVLVGEGSSYNAALFGMRLFEMLSDIPCAVYRSGEFIYSKCVLDKNTLVIAVSHRGETADTLSCVRRAVSAQAQTLALTSTKTSSLSLICERTMLTDSDYYNSSSLCSFIYSSMSLALLALYIGMRDSVVTDIYLTMALKMAELLSGKIASAVKDNTAYSAAVNTVLQCERIYTCANSVDYSAALETADKIRRVANKDCTAVPISEIVTYPSDLIMGAAVLVFETSKVKGVFCELQLSRLQALGAKIILFTTENLEDDITHYDTVISVNDTLPIFNPIPCAAAGYRLAERLKSALEETEEENLAAS